MPIEIVDNRYRDESDDTIEMTDALLEGKTVFLPDIDNGDVNSIYARMLNSYSRKLKRRSRTINGKTGFVIWLDADGSSDD